VADERALPPETLKALIDRLSRLPTVSRQGKHEAEALVHALSDLEGAFRAYLDHELPALLRDDLSDEQLLDALWEIGEGISHIEFHLLEAEFFRPYVERGRANAEAANHEGDHRNVA
jgi:hypothetical protein